MSSTIELSEDEYDQRMQAAVENALNKQATAAEVDALGRIEAAKAQALQSVKRPTSLFHSFVPTEELSEILENDPVHSLLGSAFSFSWFYPTGAGGSSQFTCYPPSAPYVDSDDEGC